MARLVKFGEESFKIRDAEFSLTVTDSNNRTYSFDQYWIFNPEAHKAFKFTTVLSVIKWWVANRESLSDQLGGYYSLLRDHMDVYFNVYGSDDYSFEFLKDCMYGLLRSPSLQVSVARDSSGYILLDRNDDSTYRILPKKAGVTLKKELQPATSSSIWEREHNYSFRMDPEEYNFFRSVKNENSVMFGMELEVCTQLTTHEIQRIITEVEPKQEPFFIFKQDSSITGKHRHKVEIVTVPCTPRYLRKNWKIFFQKLEKLCAAKGLTLSDVFDTRRDLNNGLHIHVSKESFDDKPHYNKFLCAWNQWNKSVVNFFNIVSDRPTDYSKNSYCCINSSYEGTVLSRRLRGLSTNGERSVAHNRSSATIEVRIYQGIFDLKHIMKCISFTEAVFEYCQNIGYSGFDGKFVRSMSKFVRKERKFASLYELFDKALNK